MDFDFQLQAEQLHAHQGTEGGWDKRQTHTDPNDGTVYEWDAERKGWFPKIDDNFLAAYHANYGVPQPETTPTDHAQSTPVVTTQEERGVQGEAKAQPVKETEGSDEPDKSRKRKQEENSESGWFDIDESKNHNIYVSGLPYDITLEEFSEIMSKYGIVMEDDDGDLKIKLYRDINGELKGDGLCCYLKIESVALSLQLMDGMNLRGHTISAQKAKFSLKGSYNPALKKKPAKKKKKSKVSVQEKLLDWRERKTANTEHKTKYDKIVIVSHAFHPKEFEDDAMLINEIRDDLREECGKFGVVKKVLLFDRHPGGVASVGFKEAESAAACVAAMNGRWYGGRQLAVEVWDGVTNYQVEETEKEREERLKQWESFLEDEEGGDGGKEDGDKTRKTKDMVRV